MASTGATCSPTGRATAGRALLALGLSVAGAARADDRLVLGLPAEVDLVGPAAGLRPEVLVGLDRAGVAHLRGAVGILPGLEYLYLPASLGWRARMRPARRVHPQLGLGGEVQSFWVADAPPVFRGAAYLELGLSVDVDERWALAGAIVPEVAVTGVPGPGLGLRLGVERELW